MSNPISPAVATFLNSKEFNRLLTKGKDQAFITAEEINDALPAGVVLASDIDEVMGRILELKIDVMDQAVEEEEDEEGIRLDGTEIIEEALSREEKAELRSASTDPVKLYLKRMGSVALLTREGEVVIAKEIEEGEREIILSALSSTHALKEVGKLREKIETQENPQEFVKELVRGLDDESSPADIKKVKDRIYTVIDQIAIILQETEKADGTLKALDIPQKKLMDEISAELADLTFNRKIINSFVEPVKKYYLQFTEMFDQQDRIFKFLEVGNSEDYKVLLKFFYFVFFIF